MSALTPEERAAFNADCNRCAAFYENNPGLANHRAIVDLYNALARFAALTDPELHPRMTEKAKGGAV